MRGSVLPRRATPGRCCPARTGSGVRSGRNVGTRPAHPTPRDGGLLENAPQLEHQSPRVCRGICPDCCRVVGASPAWADTAAERLTESTVVLKEIMETPDQGIPEDLLKSAYCVVIVPGVKNVGFVVGAEVRARLRGVPPGHRRWLGRSGCGSHRRRQRRLPDWCVRDRPRDAGDGQDGVLMDSSPASSRSAVRRMSPPARSVAAARPRRTPRSGRRSSPIRARAASSPAWR